MNKLSDLLGLASMFMAGYQFSLKWGVLLFVVAVFIECKIMDIKRWAIEATEDKNGTL